MNIFAFLSSLDTILYELMSWFVFFPITMWLLLREPLATMRYAEAQLKLEEDQQYLGTVSPPIMLILTIALLQVINMAVVGDNPIVRSRHGLSALVDDNISLFLLRLVLFGSFALILATRKVQRSAIDLDRQSLKPAFYAQCYAISPFALILGCGMDAAAHQHFYWQLGGLVAIAGACLFYGIVQIRWFQRELGQSFLRSFVDASVGMIASIATTISVGLLFR